VASGPGGVLVDGPRATLAARAAPSAGAFPVRFPLVSAPPLAPLTPPPRLLAIDSSTERLCLGLHAGPDRQWTVEEAGGAQASARLLPLVQQGLAALGLTLQTLDAIAFARGPGAFTGLRTACAVAQGLAFGAGKPVLALDSLLIVAEDARIQAGVEEAFEVWVAMDARMDEVYAAAYRHGAQGWQTRRAPALYTLEALQAAWQADPPTAVAGSALLAFAGRLPVEGVRTWPTEAQRAAAMLRLAGSAWRAGEAIDAADALPLYLRDKVALTTAEREARRSAEGPA